MTPSSVRGVCGMDEEDLDEEDVVLSILQGFQRRGIYG
jgi:hypothetical protein